MEIAEHSSMTQHVIDVDALLKKSMEMSTVLTSSRLSHRPTYSCVRCSDRKVKCDRQNPCGTCLKHNVQCLFRALPPTRKEQKRVKKGGLKDKLKRYEALLQELGTDPNGLPKNSEAEQRRTVAGSEVPRREDALQVPTPASTAPEVEGSMTNPQLLRDQGRSKFVDNLWSRMVQEFHDSEEALKESSCEASDASDSDDDHGFVLGVAKKPNNRYSHPPTEKIRQLWQIFIENVDPLTKVVHVPSLQLAIHKAITNIERVPRNFEALMFAIYAAAIMSLNDNECQRKFSEPRETLLSYYTSATKWALSRAKFMGTVSIVVLQALVIHLFSVRNLYGPRTVWTLTGVAIRIAEGIGLHRDGASLGVPPFEAEIRARIWWQLKMHDFRATEIIGLAKVQGFYPDDNECKPPANINDNELYPGMSSPATSSMRVTDMTFFVFKTELASFASRRGAKSRQTKKDTDQLDDIAARSDQETKEELIKEIEAILQEKFLRYCDPSKPLQLLTMLVAQFTVNVVRFLTHHPRRWVSQEQTPKAEQEYVWTISLALLEQHDLIQSDRRLQGFAWYSAYYLHWHVLIHVLDTLRNKPLMPDIYIAWRLIEATYQNNPDMISSTKKPIHVAVGNLCLNAFNAYEAALAHEGMTISREPDYIAKLRQQREAAKARRIARDARSEEGGAIHSYEPLEDIETRTRPDPRISPSKGDFNDDQPQQNSSIQLTNLSQASKSEPFWLTSGLDDSLYETSDDIMNMDTDFMLAQDYNFEDASDQSIDWAKWDAWLGEQNMAHAGDSVGSTKFN